MKIIAHLVLPVFGLMLSLSHAMAGPRDAQWKEAEQKFAQAQPQSAIEILRTIETAAQTEKAWPELARAIGFRIVAETAIQGGHPEEKIRRYDAEIAKATADTKPVLQTLAAIAVWEYFQVNRWRILQRTRTTQEPGKDFETWDLPRIFAEIDSRYRAALANPAPLQAIPIADFDALIEKGTVPDRFRPTLYDFLVSEAITFYGADEQAGAAPQDAFEFDAASPALGTMAEFLAWKPESTDAASPKLRAIGLYQDLMRFHAKDADAGARAAVDLARIEWAAGEATGEKADERAREQLNALLAANADDEIAAAVAEKLGERLFREGNYVEARKVASAAAERHPQSVFSGACRNLVRRIEAPELQLSTERVWNAAGPQIEVRYRNLEEVHFRLIPWEWSPGERRWDLPDNPQHDRMVAALNQKPAAEWRVALEKTDDFKLRPKETPGLLDQKPGFYLLIASARPDFALANNQVSAAPLWVSPLALITRPVKDAVEGFVLDAVSGEPIPGASIESWVADRNGRWVKGTIGKTDEMGFFREAGKKDTQVLLLARHKEAALSQGGQLYLWSNEQRPEAVRTVFFTDRSLYRPGQTIRFKGVHLHANTEQNDYRSLGGKKLTITLQDANGEEVEKLEVTTNDRGGFSGSFTAPKGRVTGRMTILESNRGASQISMEEYKRPKFQVTVDAPKDAPKLGEAVTVRGKAESYAGAAIDGAEVRWRVTREARWPGWLRWCGWFYPPMNQAVKEIAHGVTKTGADGSFEVRFTADPDRTVAEKSEPSFVYSITADVTDTAGETRSGDGRVTAGYTALKAEMSADEWQTAAKPVTVKVSTATLDGEPLAAEGTVTLHRLKAPDQPHRPRIGSHHQPRHFVVPAGAPQPEAAPDLSDPNHWPLGEVVQRDTFKSDAEGKASVEVKLAAGEYRAVLETKDRFGRAVTALLPLRVLDPESKTFPVPVANHLSARSWKIEPGESLEAIWGTGYANARAFVELEHRGKILKRYWTESGSTQQRVEMPVTEAERGGFTLIVTQVRANRAHLQTRHIDVPWTNKEYTLRWERMRSKIEPGSKETWTLVVEGAKDPAAMEMVAGMYDASLDAFLPHRWMGGFGVFYHDHTLRSPTFQNRWLGLNQIVAWQGAWDNQVLTWRQFPHQLRGHGPGGFGGGGMREREFQRKGAMPMRAGMVVEAASAPMATAAAMDGLGKNAANGLMLADAKGESDKSRDEAGGAAPGGAGSAVDWSQVTARKNLEETAFFFPHLTADEKGAVRLEFTLPEALTTWNFLGFAHDTQLRAGLLTGETVSAKDLMVQPNPPRFLREGDTVEFTVKVTNKASQTAKGKARLEFSDAASLKNVDPALGNKTPEISIDIPANESRTYAWRIQVPDGQSFLHYRAVASAGTVSDGEEGWLPVLSRRILVTESLTLPIREAGEKTFTLPKLLASGKSDTLRHQSLTAQVVSQPAWYAVQSLPYLMEYPHDCTEAVFNRLYANALARHIAMSNPKIRRVFDIWRDFQPEALDSPLLKNADLKSVLIEETPWLRDAKDETQARRNVGILFDDNRLQAETAAALQKLESMQIDNGAWPWFPGGRENEFITLYLVNGFGRLRHLGVEIDDRLALRALDRLDAWITERHKANLRNNSDSFGSTEALYLYARSFFLDRRPIPGEHKPAVDYFIALAKKKWPDLGARMSQAHVALGLKRFGDKDTPATIVQSFRERSVSNEELGTFWRDTEQHWWWYRAPIETQAMMIETFREVANDQETADACRVWLLKQRQTQAWPSTKSTADAVYSLLLGGDDLLGSDALVAISLGGAEVKPEKTEAGTGFYEKRFAGGEIKPAMGTVKLKKTDAGVSWGSLHWQYLEDVAKITPHEGNPLTLKKSLYLKTNGKAGPELKPVAPGDQLKPGDEVVTRVELRTDRDLEFVHLKDQRGSGTEPVNVLSTYRFQDGLAYYESTRDAASHFFIEYLPKGVYVFETSVRVQLRGQYQSGIAEIQCLYAPEFNSHSGSVGLEVK